MLDTIRTPRVTRLESSARLPAFSDDVLYRKHDFTHTHTYPHPKITVLSATKDGVRGITCNSQNFNDRTVRGW